MRQPGFYSGREISAPVSTIIPPTSATVATTQAWFGANWSLFSRFTLAVPATIRYINFVIGVASGNIQVGVGSLAGNGNAAQAAFTRIAHTGVIACPTAGNIHQDLGASVTLSPGNYALFFWADNTTVTTAHGSSTPFNSSRLTFNVSNASGIGATETIAATSRWIQSLTAEAE